MQCTQDHWVWVPGHSHSTSVNLKKKWLHLPKTVISVEKIIISPVLQSYGIYWAPNCKSQSLFQYNVQGVGPAVIWQSDSDHVTLLPRAFPWLPSAGGANPTSSLTLAEGAFQEQAVLLPIHLGQSSPCLESLHWVPQLSKFTRYTDHLGILLKYRFWFNRSGVGLEILYF